MQREGGFYLPDNRGLINAFKPMALILPNDRGDNIGILERPKYAVERRFQDFT